MLTMSRKMYVPANCCHIHCYVRCNESIVCNNVAKLAMSTSAHTEEPKWYITVLGFATDRAAKRIWGEGGGGGGGGVHGKYKKRGL